MALPTPPTDSLEALEAYTLQYLQNGTQEEQGRLLMTMLFRANRSLALRLAHASLPLLTNAASILRFEADDEDANQFVYVDEAGLNAMVQRFLETRPGYVNSPDYVLGGNFIWRKLDGSGSVNTAPAASNVTIAGSDTAKVGVQLTGTSTYSDAENDQQASLINRWYRADNSSGLNRTVIAGAQAATYTPVSADQGKVLQYGAAYTAATGTVQGAETFSSYTAVVAGATGGAAPTISSDFQNDWASQNMVRPFSTGQPDGRGGTTATAIVPDTSLTYEHSISYEVLNTEAGKEYWLSFRVAGDYDYLDITGISLEVNYPQVAKGIFRLSSTQVAGGNDTSLIEPSEGGFKLVTVKLTSRGLTTRIFLNPSMEKGEPYVGDGVKAFLVATPSIDAV